MSAAHSNEPAEGCTLFRAVERDRLGLMPVFITLLRSDRHVYLLNVHLIKELTGLDNKDFFFSCSSDVHVFSLFPDPIFSYN